jgi:hypothetical protein
LASGDGEAGTQKLEIGTIRLLYKKPTKLYG